MYSSNEYESLELEPKLLISVSALFYPKRSMVWSRFNGWGWSRGGCFLVPSWRNRQRRGDFFRVMFSEQCQRRVNFQKISIQTKCHASEQNSWRSWTFSPSDLNLTRQWKQTFLDIKSQGVCVWKPRMLNIQLPCVGHQLPWMNFALGQLSAASWMDELPGYACNVSRFTGSYVYFMSASGAVLFHVFP